MKKSLNCIMLIDDDFATNLFHKIVIEEAGCTEKIIEKTGGKEALEYLNNPENQMPDLILLDINMPGMNGWEFLEEYKSQFYAKHEERIILMLSTSSAPEDIEKATINPLVKGFCTKPLVKENLSNMIEKYAQLN